MSAEKTQGDLPTQLEGLLHVVWSCERWWAVEDRVDLAVRVGTVVRRPAGGTTARRSQAGSSLRRAHSPTMKGRLSFL
jgi:hypothetical protein